MAFQYGPAEHEQVGQMMKAIVDALKPFRAKRVPAILAAMALLKCAKALTQKMPPRLSEPFLEGAKAFLAGENPEQFVTPFDQGFLQ